MSVLVVMIILIQQNEYWNFKHFLAVFTLRP